MNIKDLVLPVGFAIVSVLALNYFFPGSTSKEVAESTFIAPKEKKEYKPLNVEVDFYDQKRTASSQTTDFETEWGYVSFSTEGASLDSIDFKRESDGQSKLIRTIFPVTDTQRSDRCFLVALQDATPFHYTLLSFEENDNALSLIHI